MRRWMVAVIAILFVSFMAAASTLAGPNAGGVLLVHANPSLTYTVDTQGYCGQSGLEACSLAVTSVPWDPETTTVFFVLAAFPDATQPRLKALSWGVEWDTSRLVILAHGSCADFDVPDGGWPASGKGIGQSFTQTKTGLLTELYWFAGYAHGAESDTASFAVIPHPLHGGTMADDAMPPVEDSVASYGALGFGIQGRAPCPANQSGGGDSGGGEEDPEQGGGFPVGPPFVEGLTFVELGSTSDTAFVSASRSLEQEYGLDILVGLAPDGIYCLVDEGKKSVLETDPRVLLVTDATISAPAAESTEPGTPGFSALVWNAMLTAPSPDLPGKEMAAPIDSVVGYSQRSIHEPPRTSGAETSVYMLGEVGLSLIFTESSDNHPCDATHLTENWEEHDPGNEKAAAIAEVTTALTNLALQAPNASLKFYIVDTPTCTTSVEPIDQYCGAPGNPWRVEALHALGDTTSDDAAQLARNLNNKRRREVGTDWWCTAFLVRSRCHQAAGHGWFGPSPTVGVYGCSWTIYGPWLTVCSHPHSRSMGYCLTHESCHMFGALDEYEISSCADSSGYLRWRNLNAQMPGTGCQSHVTCLLAADWDSWNLCEHSRRQVGWWDRDGDSIYDPIDHPNSSASMLVGENEGLALGDSVSIYTSGGEWIKRLDASKWGMDQGYALWDGIDYRGLPKATGTYKWNRNGGQLHEATLSSDDTAPVISDLKILQGPGAADTLSFLFVDDDTRGGRVRATVSGSFPNAPPSDHVIPDEFLLDTSGSGRPVKRALNLSSPGPWQLMLRVWDPGNQYDLEVLPMWEGGRVEDGELVDPVLVLSRGRPTPSSESVAWDLQRSSPGEVTLMIVGVDGRRVRSWPARGVEAGATRIVWDGRDDRGMSVPAGRYFLIAKEESGRTVRRNATILR